MKDSNVKIVVLKFDGLVHFGNTQLSDATLTFRSDTMYSALFIEALKLGKNDEFFKMVTNDELLISDLLPWDGEAKIANIDEEIDETKYGKSTATDKVSLDIARGDEDNKPYTVGGFKFEEDKGLCFIAKGCDKALTLLKQLLASLALTGIGGKKSSGYGRFDFECKTDCKLTDRVFDPTTDLAPEKAGLLTLISTALPKDDELEKALDGAKYRLIRRGGFIDSTTYTPTFVKKRNVFAFKAGSEFKKPFSGDIVIVGNKGTHDVYRFLKPLFLIKEAKKHE